MTNEELKNISSVIDTLLDEAITDSARQKVKDKLTEVCQLAIQALETQPNRCDSCIHSEEQDGSNCYECVKGTIDNFEAQQTKMSDATEEERKSVKDYIESISKPTGLQFDDIYEELDFVQPHKKTSVNLQLCEDCISREESVKGLTELINNLKGVQGDMGSAVNSARELIKTLPSIIPQTTCEDAVSRKSLVNELKCGYWNKDLQSAKDDTCVIDSMIDWCIRTVKSQPPVFPQRKKGKWIGYKCSECNYEVMKWNKNNYCPNCGAEMEGDKE